MMPSPKEIVRDFVLNIRSGKKLETVHHYMAPKVLAHQIWAEGGATVERTPAQYREHIEEFQQAFGDFTVTIEDIIADEDRVYVRWRQDGFHKEAHSGEAVTGKPLTEVTSTVYRIEGGKIVEYWLQTDRKGMEVQVTATAE
ncbi:ester cyclase [Kordiimonas laminariae]|uniref:ester cyclase n=1 Tax=Kordiimonas laminariae TaxID=2917717 RepID=UPI001FF47E56|nr:ester cyclase [Kordiimonas laminariae]MCK0069970.1 ester cyclase [Kordiimonas laminariae]